MDMTNTIPNADLPTVYVHRSTWSTPDGVDPSWPVVNAPRPLAGEVTWDGEFRHGLFYAAGPRRESLQAEWDSSDAWPVVVVDNADVVRMVLEYAEREGYCSTLAELDALGVSVADVAVDLGLPYIV